MVLFTETETLLPTHRHRIPDVRRACLVTAATLAAASAHEWEHSFDLPIAFKRFPQQTFQQ